MIITTIREKLIENYAKSETMNKVIKDLCELIKKYHNKKVEQKR